jgi:type II secretion system protein G
MNQSPRNLWIWVLAQACCVAAIFGWQIYYETLPPYPIETTYADMCGGIKSALDEFSNDCGRYPTTVEGLNALITRPSNIPKQKWHGPYVDPPQVPQDPWRHDYVYSFPSIHGTNSFDLYSCGSDGISKSGGQDLDDLNNWNLKSLSASGVVADSRSDAVFLWIRALLIVPLLFTIELIQAIKSQQARHFIVTNRTAYIVWLLISLSVLFWNYAGVPRLMRV